MSDNEWPYYTPWKTEDAGLASRQVYDNRGIPVSALTNATTARLIDAAPELLAALDEVVREGLSVETFAKAQAAIAKATAQEADHG